MSMTLTIIISLVTVLNVLACGWLIWWTARSRPDEAAKGEVTGHVWDGDLEERNNPMPRWWLILFFRLHRLLSHLLRAVSLTGLHGWGSWLEQAEAVCRGNGCGQCKVRAAVCGVQESGYSRPWRMTQGRWRLGAVCSSTIAPTVMVRTPAEHQDFRISPTMIGYTAGSHRTSSTRLPMAAKASCPPGARLSVPKGSMK